MNRKNQAREALSDRMLEVRSEQEVELAEKDAEGWLQEKLGDDRVIKASERPAKMGTRARDPECGDNRPSLTVLVSCSRW